MFLSWIKLKHNAHLILNNNQSIYYQFRTQFRTCNLILYYIKKKINQIWWTIPLISTKQTITSHLKSLNTIKQTTTYDVGNPCPGLGQAQGCGWVKPVNEILTSPLDGLVRGVECHFQQYASNMVAISFIGGWNRSTWRKPPTCHKSLTNFIA